MASHVLLSLRLPLTDLRGQLCLNLQILNKAINEFVLGFGYEVRVQSLGERAFELAFIDLLDLIRHIIVWVQLFSIVLFVHHRPIFLLSPHFFTSSPFVICRLGTIYQILVECTAFCCTWIATTRKWTIFPDIIMVAILIYMPFSIEATLPWFTRCWVRLIALRATILFLSLSYRIECLFLSNNSLLFVHFLNSLCIYCFTSRIMPILRCSQFASR